MRTRGYRPTYNSWWYSDSARYDYVKSDLFWTLAILILVNCWWSTKQVDSFPDNDEKPEDKPPRPGFWLKERVTSRLRQYVALFICTLMFPLQLLHGSWVLKSAWRITFGLVKRTYPSVKPRMLAFIVYSPITAAIVAAWVIVLSGGVLIIGTQILLWTKLWQMKPTAAVVSPPGDLKDGAEGDGDWHEVKEDEKEDGKTK
ncbi:hypothetical protein FGRMN_1676 [Fusarium graminum]|nr:hypothetical protein FGRMN_1676 [Fusarium graminum]